MVGPMVGWDTEGGFTDATDGGIAVATDGGIVEAPNGGIAVTMGGVCGVLAEGVSATGALVSAPPLLTRHTPSFPTHPDNTTSPSVLSRGNPS